MPKGCLERRIKNLRQLLLKCCFKTCQKVFPCNTNMVFPKVYKKFHRAYNNAVLKGVLKF